MRGNGERGGGRGTDENYTEKSAKLVIDRDAVVSIFNSVGAVTL